MTATVGKGRKSPCKDRPDRYPGCQDHCQKPALIAWKEEQNTIRKNRQKHTAVLGYTAKEIFKNRRVK